MNRQPLGFTLIELMIVVAIVAILAAVAIPAYRSYVLRANRVEAKTALEKLYALQEKHFLTHNQYATSLGASASPTQIHFPGTTENGYYKIEIAVSGSNIHLVATTLGPQQDDDNQCRQFFLTLPAGTRTSKYGPTTITNNPERCW